jgi:hypothetical protein
MTLMRRTKSARKSQPARKPAKIGKTNSHTRRQDVIGRKIDEIYIALDSQLTNLAHIQLQLDELRAKIRRI